MNHVDVVVTGATGHIGQELVGLLLKQKRTVRAVARDAEKLKKLAQQGAETVIASFDDAAAMSKAFAGAKAAFVMIPPNYGASDFRAYQNNISEALAFAVQAANVPHVVQLSSEGAHLSEGTGPIVGLHDSEIRFNKLPNVNVLHLRPVFFMENLLANLGLIQSQGINGTPAKPDLAIPMIATKDIAADAAKLLASPSFTGKSVRELHGSGEYTMTQATRFLGKALGKPDLKYIQFPYADTEKALTGMGFSADVARLFVEMYRGFNDGLIKPETPRTADNTTPTTLENFVTASLGQLAAR